MCCLLRQIELHIRGYNRLVSGEFYRKSYFIQKRHLRDNVFLGYATAVLIQLQLVIRLHSHTVI